MSAIYCESGYSSISLGNGSTSYAWYNGEDTTITPTCDSTYSYYQDCLDGDESALWEIADLSNFNLEGLYQFYCTDVVHGIGYSWIGTGDGVFPCASGKMFDSSNSANNYCSDCGSGEASPAGFGQCIDCRIFDAIANDDQSDCVCDDGSYFDWTSLNCSGSSDSASSSLSVATASLVTLVASLVIAFGQY